MKFSVIIPAYNAESTIELCLKSLLEQSFPDFEGIIIDDGSKDSTSHICTTYAAHDSRLRYIRQENQGVSAARNQGLEKASGEFVVFLDSDDRYTRDYLQSFHSLIETYPDRDHYWCGFQPINAITMAYGVPVCCPGEPVTITSRRTIMSLHERWMDSTLWNKAYRRSILTENHIRMEPSLSLGEDLLFNFEYLDHGRPEIVICNAPLYEYYQAENGSLDSKYRSDLKAIYDILDEKILFYLRKWHIAPEELTKYYNSVFYMQEKILRNTFRPESTLSRRERYTFNRQILKSEKFQRALRQSTCFIHPLFRFGYRIGSWPLLQLLDQLAAYKKQQ